jgi:hypothetical protein
MGRRKPTAKAEFVLFNVLYEDGTVTSNRKVSSAVLGGLEKDEPARAVIEEQDREIAERGGQPRGAIKSMSRVGERPPASGPGKYADRLSKERA